MQNKGNTVIIAILVLVCFAAVGVSGFLFLQNQKLVLPTPSNTPTPSPVLVINNIPSTPIATVLPTATPTATSKAVVVIEQKASISVSELDQIQKRIIDPYLDYYKETNGADYVVSLTIAPNTQSSKANYPYTAKAVYKVGAYNDFLIEKQLSGIIWWLPECLNGCMLSESFKTKYPEIAAKVN